MDEIKSEIMDASAMKSSTQYAEPGQPVKGASNGQGNAMLGEDSFHQMIYLEKKRTERSGKPFLLMLINIKNITSYGGRIRVFNSINSVLSANLRDTDIRGWFEYNFIQGVIFTEMGETDVNLARERIYMKIRDGLLRQLGREQIGKISIYFQSYTGLRDIQAVERTLNAESFENERKGNGPERRTPGFLNTLLRQRCSLFAGDVFCISLTHFLSMWISSGRGMNVAGAYTGAHIFSIWLYPAALYVLGLYSLEKAHPRSWVALRTCLAVLLVAALSGMWLYLVDEWDSGCGILAIQTALILLMLMGWRLFCRSLLQVGRSKIPTLVLGAGETGKSVYELLSEPYSPYEVAGFLDDDPGKQGKVMGSPAVLGTLDQIGDIASQLGAKAAVVALPGNRPASLTRKILEARLLGVEVIELTAIYERLKEKIPVQYIEDQWMLFADGFYSLSKASVRKLKRIIDFAVASLLLLLTAPLMAMAALALRLESPGPVFCQQQRVGKGGKVFTVLKFRTMRSDEENSDAHREGKRDPGFTQVGRWIRILRIDELPHIWNVYTGEMSLIGPRPERPEFVKELESQIPCYRVRHSVTPGIMGWAQAKYPYGASFDDAVRKLEYDLYYIKNMSMFLDLKIILRTIGVMILGEGAR